MEAARSLGYDAGLEAAETVIRAGTLTRGGMLEKLLGADPGYRGPRVPCRHGHQAEFASYRDKVIDTVLGPVASPAPGTTAGKAAAAGPFAKAAGLLAAWPGAQLTAKRVERAAGDGGTAKAAADRIRARAIMARTLVPLPPSPLPDKLYAAIDGTGVLVATTETAGRDGKGEDGRAAPARSSSPSSSPRTSSTRTAIRSVTGIPPATSPPSSPPASSRTSWRPRASAAARPRLPAHHPRRRRRLDLEHRQAVGWPGWSRHAAGRRARRS